MDLQLQKTYTSRQHLTRNELTHYRTAFQLELTNYLPPESSSMDADLRQIQFNALHFGGRLLLQ